MTGPALKRVRVRLLPWKPRWRSGKDRDLPDVSGALDLADDPISFVIALVALIVLAPFVLLLVVGVLLLSVEIVLLLALLPLLLLVQVFGLRPWVLVLTDLAGTRSFVEVHGTRRMLAQRRLYRAQRS